MYLWGSVQRHWFRRRRLDVYHSYKLFQHSSFYNHYKWTREENKLDIMRLDLYSKMYGGINCGDH